MCMALRDAYKKDDYQVECSEEASATLVIALCPYLGRLQSLSFCNETPSQPKDPYHNFRKAQLENLIHKLWIL
jgi:hypothetical protein